MEEPVWIWGVPFSPMTLAETVDAVDALIEAGRPAYFITANTHYAMLTRDHPDLDEVNGGAAFIVADGAPLVWASRWSGTPVPERVAGSDLIFRLSERAAVKGHRLYLLGAAEGVAQEAARRLTARYPGLRIVGTESPPFRELTEAEEDQLVARVRAARPDLLMVASTMPKGERWLAAKLDALRVPAAVNLGASFDFAAGRVERAPRWVGKIGLEWAFRLMLEPRRLASRYARNAWFVLTMMLRGPGRRSARRLETEPDSAAELTGAGR